ncbi:type VI secretion system-associated FHA domain protein TagH [Oceanicola sp. D3]|uniref:type VI secretion system-associated FHA domain protein TagH n=1 Tax=Oceanicola sp. D3 TaxID=2587163 RepID=UPI00111D3780|nr:type VI secretion system-associated FHA domain protein TagH [Oceanicola sp. D3]QDC10319.1 type VI secretion system-associated FHA domain protein TagH [Oceanicola sp. D3]
MTLTLRIDNFPSLPDGGPIEFSTDQGGFEIGRDPAMDWTLPDPNRFVSSCHAEIRYENGTYWLYDVSTNGTFVNGGSMRVKSPYQLQSGDKLQIGHYLVVAQVAAAQSAPAPAFEAPPPASPGPSAFDQGGGGGGGDIWSVGGGGGGSGAAAPPSSGDFSSRSGVGGMSDFGDQHIDLPDFGGSETGTPPPPAQGGAGGGSPFGDAPPPQQPPQAPPPQQPPVSESASPFGDVPPPSAPEPQAPPPAQETTGSPFGPGPSAPPEAPEQAPQPPETTGSPFGPGPAETPAQAEPPQQQQPPAPEPTPAAPPPPTPAAPPPVSPTAPAAEAFAAPPVQAPSTPLPKAGSVGDVSGLLAAIADGAGISPKAFEGPDPGAVAHEIGRALRIMVGELAGLLKARAATKQSLKSGSRTMIGADANNPLKFMPGAAEQLEVMFGTGRQGYMRGAETVQKSFNDIKMHQYAVHAALQPALARLLEDMSPEAVEEKVEGGRFGGKDSRAWQIYVERWDAKTHPYDNGMLDVFLAYFSEAYDDVMEKTENQ